MRYYGTWAGNETGTREDPARCIVAVWNGPWSKGTQCGRKRGHGPDGCYCKQHAKQLEQGRPLSVPEVEPDWTVVELAPDGGHPRFVVKFGTDEAGKMQVRVRRPGSGPYTMGEVLDVLVAVTLKVEKHWALLYRLRQALEVVAKRGKEG